MIGENPFGRCPGSLPVNTKLISFDTNLLIRDMSMFLDFALGLNIQDLRKQLKENKWGGYGYSIQKYYHLILYYKVPFHSLEYVVPTAIFGTPGKSQQSILILNIATAMMYLCFAKPFVPYDYNELIEHESSGQEIAEPNYNDLFTLVDAFPHCFLSISGTNDYSIPPDHWSIPTFIEVITQMCLAKMHQKIHTCIRESLPYSGIFFHKEMKSLIHEEFVLLENVPAAHNRLQEIIGVLDENIQSENGNMMDAALELSDNYPFYLFIDMMFKLLQRAYDESKNSKHIIHFFEKSKELKERFKVACDDERPPQPSDKKRSQSESSQLGDASRKRQRLPSGTPPADGSQEDSQPSIFGNVSTDETHLQRFSKFTVFASSVLTMGENAVTLSGNSIPLLNPAHELERSTAFKFDDSVRVWGKGKRLMLQIDQSDQAEINQKIQRIFSKSPQGSLSPSLSPRDISEAELPLKQTNIPLQQPAPKLATTRPPLPPRPATRPPPLPPSPPPVIKTKSANNKPTSTARNPRAPPSTLSRKPPETFSRKSEYQPLLKTTTSAPTAASAKQPEGQLSGNKPPATRPLSTSTNKNLEIQIPEYVNDLIAPPEVHESEWRDAAIQSYNRFIKSVCCYIDRPLALFIND